MQQTVNLFDLGSTPGGGANPLYGNRVNQRVPGSSPGWGAKDAGYRKAQTYCEYIALPTDLYTIWCDSFFERWCNGSTRDFAPSPNPG